MYQEKSTGLVAADE